MVKKLKELSQFIVEVGGPMEASRRLGLSYFNIVRWSKGVKPCFAYRDVLASKGIIVSKL